MKRAALILFALISSALGQNSIEFDTPEGGIQAIVAKFHDGYTLQWENIAKFTIGSAVAEGIQKQGIEEIRILC